MSKIYFIGGASGSGKSSIMHNLKNLLGKSINIYDFDDIGVPDNANKIWRQESTEKWLNKLSFEENSCLLGQIVLGEILSCPLSALFKSIEFCLLDVSDYERIQIFKIGEHMDLIKIH
jgi:hypothetical protein